MKQLVIFPLLVMLCWSAQAQRLNVESEDFYIGRLKRTVGGGASLIFENANADTAAIGIDAFDRYFMQSPDDMYFQTSGTTRMLINAGGNVGIGVSNPLRQLHIKESAGTSIIARIESENENGATIDFKDPNTTADFLARIGGKGDGLIFIAGGVERMNITSNGRVGIGTSDPIRPLHIKGDPGGSIPVRIESTNTNGSTIDFKDPNTTGDFVARIGGKGDGLTFIAGGAERMNIMDNGSIGIGTNTIPSGYRLAVDGNIIAERVRVRLSQNWPDYVFEADYDLMPLEELKQSIQQNGHLPNIPAAQVMEEEGQDLGEIQVKMMEKIEELTLYILEMNDHISELNNKIKVLEEAQKK